MCGGSLSWKYILRQPQYLIPPSFLMLSAHFWHKKQILSNGIISGHRRSNKQNERSFFIICKVGGKLNSYFFAVRSSGPWKRHETEGYHLRACAKHVRRPQRASETKGRELTGASWCDTIHITRYREAAMPISLRIPPKQEEAIEKAAKKAGKTRQLSYSKRSTESLGFVIEPEQLVRKCAGWLV